MSIRRFHWLDYVVAVAMLVVSLGIGFFFAFFKGGQKTKVGYLLGDRKMHLAPVCLSMFVTFQSAISLIGTPGDTYDTGPMIVYLYVGIALAYVVGFFTVVPLMYPLHLTSVYEYLSMRFQSTAVRLLGTCIGMFQTMLYMAVALFSPALALQAAAGLPLWMSVAIVGVIGTVYTTVGGIKSVVWTDAVQTVIVFIGMATVLIKGVIAVGGFSSMTDTAYEGGRMNFAELNPDPRERHSMWACLFGGCVMWLVNCFNQSSVQRIGSLKTLNAAKISFLVNVPLNLIYGATLTLTGILLYAYVISTGCDPYHAGLINNKNQMMPYFVIHVLDDMPGMAGLYMSMLFSGALSTVSSGINALAANTVEDLLARPLRGIKDATATVIVKCFVVFYGVVTIGLAYGMKAVQGPVTQLGITAFGACGGPLIGMYLLGGAFPWGNKYGAFGGGVIGLAVNLWIAIGSKLYGAPTVSLPPGPIHNCDNSTSSLSSNFSLVGVGGSNWTSDGGSSGGVSAFGYSLTTSAPHMNLTAMSLERSFSIYDLSYLWFGLVGVVISFVCGIIISFVTGRQDPQKLDSRLIFPFCRKMYRMPEPVQRPEDISNVFAMKHYRQAWDTFKKTSTDRQHVEDVGDQIRPEGQTSERMSFLKRNGAEADY